VRREDEAQDYGVYCLFSGGTNKDPKEAGVFLKTLPSATAAHATFLAYDARYALHPLPGIGDEALSGDVCEQGTCGPAATVRVANDVLFLSFANISASAPDLAVKGVQEICPLCKFPTSPPP